MELEKKKIEDENKEKKEVKSIWDKLAGNKKTKTEEKDAEKGLFS